MLYKGKHVGYYLYELTEPDLIWGDVPPHRYKVGNVLLFANKKDVALGAELVKADDLPTALTYLESNFEVSCEADSANSLDSLELQLAETKTNIAKRDELLRELSSDLESQRYSNQLLIAQLENLREQISIEQLTRNEVMGDLEVVSAETFRKDQELQNAIEAKTKLEQELAERICELLELDSANTELQKRLKESSPAIDAPKSGAGEPAASVGQVYTLPSGKQIQVYHEFPASKGHRRARGFAALAGLLRVLGLVVIGVLIFIAGSVLATAKLNGLSPGEALDLTLKALLP
ncbi:MAG: hypothetical protein LBP91_03560 [Coriobacteriales bacterium]|jgi:hypothetical protein|nr:hypothetical protein [Coriobacteriales bacterium]